MTTILEIAVPTFRACDGHEGFEEPRLLAAHGHDLDAGLDTVHGVDHQPQAGPPEPPAEHDGGHTCRAGEHTTPVTPS